MKRFENMHPAVLFLFFISVIVITGVVRTPAFTVISFICSLMLCVRIKGANAFKVMLFALPLCIFSAVINMLFNSDGMTVLFHLPNGNAVTLEAAIYGVLTSLVILSTVLWFISFGEYMTSDRVIFLMGKIMPLTALLISMTLGAVPKFLRRIKEISDAQKSFGKSVGSGSLKQRLSSGGEILTAAVAGTVESSAETAVSMKSRGFCSGKRTVYAPYRINAGDKAVIITLLMYTMLLIFCGCLGVFSYGFFPSFYITSSHCSHCVSILWGAVCLLPFYGEITRG